MTALPPSDSCSAALVFRSAFADEVPRASWLLPSFRGGLSPGWFLAVRERPIERIAGAIWYRTLPEGGVLEFDLWIKLAAPELDAFLHAWTHDLLSRSVTPQPARLHVRRMAAGEPMECPLAEVPQCIGTHFHRSRPAVP